MLQRTSAENDKKGNSPLHSSLNDFFLVFSLCRHTIWIFYRVKSARSSLWLAARVRKVDEVPGNFSCSVGSSTCEEEAG